MPQRIGEILVHMGAIKPEQVEDSPCNAKKPVTKRLFGQIALMLGFIEDNSLKRYADFLDKQDQRGTVIKGVLRGGARWRLSGGLPYLPWDVQPQPPVRWYDPLWLLYPSRVRSRRKINDDATHGQRGGS